jgi:hypothetical protein
MRNLQIAITLLFAVIVLGSCSKKETYEKTANGLEYIFHQKNNGAKTGAVGDYYFFDLIVKRSNDSIISNSYQTGVPAKFLRRKSLYPGDIYEAFSMCAEGDSISIIILADSFYNSHNFPFPEYLVPGEKLIFTMKMKEILNIGEFKMKMFDNELTDIEGFLTRKGWVTKTDSLSGLKYEITKENPMGQPIVLGDSVKISYFYYYLNEKIIARSKQDDYWNFEVGDPNYMSGLSRALSFMHEGEKMSVVLPFSEAFGEEGRAGIAPFSTIVMELEVHQVKKNKR